MFARSVTLDTLADINRSAVKAGSFGPVPAPVTAAFLVARGSYS
jgi:hypothetical protein